MRKMWRKLFGTAALAFMLCLSGLIMTGEAQAQRFVDNGNETATNTLTNLIWTKNANQTGSWNWQDAMSMCSSFGISGVGGWRLPSKDKFVVLHHEIKGGNPFTWDQSSLYWSSTTGVDFPNNAWVVFMGNGRVYHLNKITSYHVWPVRAGP